MLNGGISTLEVTCELYIFLLFQFSAVGSWIKTPLILLVVISWLLENHSYANLFPLLKLLEPKTLVFDTKFLLFIIRKFYHDLSNLL